MELKPQPDKMARVSARQSRMHLKGEYKRGATEYPAPVEEREKLRIQILQMSLFPNLYNKETLLKGM